MEESWTGGEQVVRENQTGGLGVLLRIEGVLLRKKGVLLNSGRKFLQSRDMSQEERQPLLPRPPVAKTRLVLMIRVGIDLYPTTKMRVTKIRITSPLTVFLKHGQLDFFKASDSISEYLTLIFPKSFGV